ncbi:ketopantoate reductase family protein [Anaerocolumna xylanovorans]|uniref:Ketopantoate reductase n=1 Tax=Anaerocolumna xylanovorans DSM 12503 TaxID=1121345 RepID=A0A1M7YDR7_9FIRM|nr:2-dehydropantoate 2-reductase N-terminal domain-containing protein [Anaerocolumna xylanovorans]SHO50784.1 ketopantoate reductase [Anaerocolumna xylanovorans DSM 12503]
MKEYENRVLIYGAGVIGSLYAVKLSACGCNVAVLARGSRLKELQEKGLLYYENGIKEARVRVISEITDQDKFDYIFLTVRAEQVITALEALRRNKSSTIITMVNTLEKYQNWENTAGKGRILPAFPGAGGSIENGILNAKLTPAIIQPTTFGEINGKKTDRVKQLKKLFAAAKVPVQIVPDMHVWQVCHLAMVVPLADAYYQAGKAPERVAWDKNSMKITAKRLKRNFNLLGQKGICLSPGKMKLICFLPVPLLACLLKYVYKSDFGNMFMYQHAMKAKEEMKLLHRDFYKYLKVH